MEESLTLNELFEIYEGILEREHEQFKRDAGLQGVDVPDWDEGVKEATDNEEEVKSQRESLKERVARKTAEKKGEDPKKAAEKAKSGQGIGYKLIGG